MTSLSVGGIDLLADGAAVRDGSLVHPRLENLGSNRDPTLELVLAGDAPRSVRVLLAGAAADAPVLHDADVRVEGGRASVRLPGPLSIDVPYRVSITADRTAFAFGDGSAPEVRACFYSDGPYAAERPGAHAQVVSAVTLSAAVAEGEEPIAVEVVAATNPETTVLEALFEPTTGPDAYRFWPHIVGLGYDPATCRFRGSTVFPIQVREGDVGTRWAITRVRAAAPSYAYLAGVTRDTAADPAGTLGGAPFLVPVPGLDLLRRVRTNLPPQVTELAVEEIPGGVEVVLAAVDDHGFDRLAVLAQLRRQGEVVKTWEVAAAPDPDGVHHRARIEVPAYAPSGSVEVAKVGAWERILGVDALNPTIVLEVGQNPNYVDGTGGVTPFPFVRFPHAASAAEDFHGPEIRSLRLASGAAGADGFLPLVVEAELDDDASGVVSARAKVGPPDGCEGVRELALARDPDGLYRGTVELGPGDCAGAWDAYFVSAEDAFGRTGGWSVDGDGYESYEFAPGGGRSTRGPVENQPVVTLRIDRAAFEPAVLDGVAWREEEGLGILTVEVRGGRSGLAGVTARVQASCGDWKPFRFELALASEEGDRLAQQWRTAISLPPGCERLEARQLLLEHGDVHKVWCGADGTARYECSLEGDDDPDSPRVEVPVERAVLAF